MSLLSLSQLRDAADASFPRLTDSNAADLLAEAAGVGASDPAVVALVAEAGALVRNSATYPDVVAREIAFQRLVVEVYSAVAARALGALVTAD